MAQAIITERCIRRLAWLGTATLILLPLAVLRAANPNAWAIEDLPFAFVMIAAVGIAVELALRLPSSWTRTGGTGLALATGLLLVWGNLAVGFAGTENNALNGIFMVVPAVALVGSLVARFRAPGIAGALLVTAGARILAGVIAFANGFFTGPLTVTFAGLWLVTALLFHRSMWEEAA